MSEEPQVVSISSSTPVSPEEIARKSFPTARKGVDGDAVRSFLTKVAAELRDALERETSLRERLTEAERRAADPQLDEATLTKAIGIETAKILSTAHEAAHNVVAKAEERAAELIGESERVLGEQVALANSQALAIRGAAEQEADEYVAQARAEADALTDEAHADAVELLDATKEECRRMVAEARDLRNRTLADLVARRGALRVQLEELRGGKDSLLQVVDAVATAVESLRGRLSSAEDQARIAAEQAGERVELRQGHDELAELEAELAAAGGVLSSAELGGGREASSLAGHVGTGEDPASHLAAEQDAGSSGQKRGSSASRRSVDELFARIRASRAAEEAANGAADGEAIAAEESPAIESPEQESALDAVMADVSPDSEVVEVTEVTLSSEDPEHTAEIEAVVVAEQAVESEDVFESQIAGDRVEEVAAGVIAVEGQPTGATEADETSSEAAEKEAAPAAVSFEATTAGPAGAEPKGLDADAITEPDVESLARRDHLLSAVTAKLGRALKRALQDDQNDLLNALRQTSRKPVLDELAPVAAQRDRFASAASDQLARAYEAGAAFLVTGDSVEGPSVSAPPPSQTSALEAGASLAGELADDLSAMLRQRIEEALSELDGSMEGSADAAGVAYREWKGSRVEGLAGDFTTRAFAVGELAVLESVTNGAAPLVRWAVEDDDGGGSCPDCDDNSLAGPLLPGAVFPTGHSHPPVHPGCRCLLVPVRS